LALATYLLTEGKTSRGVLQIFDENGENLPNYPSKLSLRALRPLQGEAISPEAFIDLTSDSHYRQVLVLLVSKYLDILELLFYNVIPMLIGLIGNTLNGTTLILLLFGFLWCIMKRIRFFRS